MVFLIYLHLYIHPYQISRRLIQITIQHHTNEY
nr:MAG TPA: hypothetical protein [Caudoviricetes sp.]